ncbi:MAG: T9SS type A sorting domain-containing protein, partial [Bacteroidia bacterium]|nr:T9SS type A sorting domain-containing protein [Bacteroidia bacterium]
PLGATNGDDVNFSGSIDLARNYEVTITPAGGASVTINSITFNMSRSATGPRNWAVRGSADTFTSNLNASIVTSNTNITTQAGNQFFWALDSYTVTGGKQEAGSSVSPGASYAGQTNPMTFRFYAWNAEGNAGTFRIDTVRFNGFASVMAGVKKIDYDLNSAFSVFPNPSKDGVVTIKSNNVNFQTVEVFNSLGQLVIRRKNENNYQFKLDVSEIPAGIYFIKVICDEKSITERIIISE